MSTYPYIDNPKVCAKCGLDKRNKLTKHHWKEPGHTVNSSALYKTGRIIMLCRKCHDKVHRINIRYGIHGKKRKIGGKPRGGWKS